MISGAHVILYSTDAGEGWLIFALPPAEVAVHPAEDEGHELFLITEDVAALVAELQRAGTPCTEPEDQGWGVLTRVTLPGGGQLGVYEPRHPRP